MPWDVLVSPTRRSNKTWKCMGKVLWYEQESVHNMNKMLHSWCVIMPQSSKVLLFIKGQKKNAMNDSASFLLWLNSNLKTLSSNNHTFTPAFFKATYFNYKNNDYNKAFIIAHCASGIILLLQSTFVCNYIYACVCSSSKKRMMITFLFLLAKK